MQAKVVTDLTVGIVLSHWIVFFLNLVCFDLYVLYDTHNLPLDTNMIMLGLIWWQL